MMRWMVLACASGLLAIVPVNSPAFALTAKEKAAHKAETCKFGADDQKLTGKARSSFLSKCMANEKAAPSRPAAAPAPKPAG